MRLIIYWLTLMVILPISYLFWRKKTWRLFLGVVILAILIVGWLLPGKLAFSILERELREVEEKKEKEEWIDKKAEKRGKPWQKLEKSLKEGDNPKDQKKIALEKEILSLREEREKINQEKDEWEREENEYYRNQNLPQWQGKGEEIKKKYLKALSRSIKNGYLLKQKEWEWVGKWGEKADSPVLLFCGEEFNCELLKVRTTFKGSWQLVYNRDWYSNVIDFSKYGNYNSQFLKKKLGKFINNPKTRSIWIINKVNIQ